MYRARFVDFLFTGLAIVPGVLLLAGHVGPALLLFVPLLIAAGLAGMYEQQLAAGEETADDPLAGPTYSARGTARRRLD